MDETVEPEGEEQQSLSKAGRQMTISAVVISVFLLIGKIAGYAKHMTLAHYFGGSKATDAFYTLYNAVIFNLYTKIEKLLRPTYLPEFVKVRDKEGEERAWQVASGAALMQLLALVSIAGGLVIFARPLIAAAWPELASDPRTFETSVVLLRIMAPAFVLFSLSIMPELTLHAYKRFTLPAVAEASFRTGLVLVLVGALYVLWRPGDPRAIYAAALGVAIGGSLRLFVQLPGLASKLKLLRPVAFWRDPSIAVMVGLMGPVLVGLIFSFLRTLADSMFADRMGEGTYTCLTFGRAMTDAPLQILPLAVSFVVYPFISQWAVQDDRVRMGRTLVGMSRAMVFIFLPATLAVMVLARPIISLLFEHGKFNAQDVDVAALALYCYAPVIVFLAVEGSVNKWYFALKDTLTPNIAGVAGVLIHIAIGWYSTFVLGGSVAGLALALTVSKSLKVTALYALLKGRLAGVDGRAQLVWALRTALSAAVMGAAVWATAGAVKGGLAGWQSPAGGAKVKILVLVMAVGLVGLVSYLAAAWVFGVEEVRYVVARLRRRGQEGGDE
ncbi:MAG: oligosaccharide flippase family protein [Armatimonadetes bacterium]|nr:oligosaccharide flippase family protein [Armatimonadota bacterium]